jgi:hypothetical protein
MIKQATYRRCNVNYEKRDDPNTAVVAGGKRDKDDRKQNTLSWLLGPVFVSLLKVPQIGSA